MNGQAWTRRDLLKLGLVGWGLSAGLPRSVLARPARATASGPRYFVTVVLGGGVDAVYTTNPLVKKDVESWVDVPFRPSEIIDTGSVQLGPLWAKLADASRDMAILNGVQLSTANHDTGYLQLVRMRNDAHRQMPPLDYIIGSHRDGQPLGSITVGT
jgi:hypothetical protein